MLMAEESGGKMDKVEAALLKLAEPRTGRQGKRGRVLT